MAAHYYLQIEGVPGESRDSKHKDWIDIMSWSFGESNPGTMQAGAGAGAGKVQMSDINFMTRMSKASPKLFLACANGQHMKEATLVGVRRGRGTQQEFLTWTFSDVLVSSYQTSGSDGTEVMDSVALAFSKLRVEYKLQKAEGSADDAISAGWDLTSNKGL
jgi:type VI secretion system secreted protein Hcp